MAIPNFFYRDEMTQYDFGPGHPLRPERLHRTMRLLSGLGAVQPISPEPAAEHDLMRVHSRDYVDAVKTNAPSIQHGLGISDNPIFAGMHEKSLWYVGGAVAAATAVRNGAKLAFNIAGGLHHAQRDKASGFCIYNDPAVAISILRERFGKVAYIDIDVHHGDGVQWLFYDDPTVLTISIHESGQTLYPGTGFTDETGKDNTALNIPLQAKTTGDVWLWAFQTVVHPAVEAFGPGAIVLQMGADAHFDDPLGHLMVSAQEWLEAVRLVRDIGLPIVACGGGGYNMLTVPRMWAAACMTLAGVDYSNEIPTNLADELGFDTFDDPYLPSPRGKGLIVAQTVVSELEQVFDLVLER